MVLSGAGVSTCSGIPDYLNIPDYFYKGEYYTYEELMSYECYQNQPDLFWSYYQTHIDLFKGIEVNEAHILCGELHRKGLLRGVITQNVDGLYRRVVPLTKLIELHGNYKQIICSGCHKTVQAEYIGKDSRRRSICCRALIKPDILLIGERYTKQKRLRVSKMLEGANTLIVMGTRLRYPYLQQLVSEFKGLKILINNQRVEVYQTFPAPYGYQTYLMDWDEEYLIDFTNFNSDEWVELLRSRVGK